MNSNSAWDYALKARLGGEQRTSQEGISLFWNVQIKGSVLLTFAQY